MDINLNDFLQKGNADDAVSIFYEVMYSILIIKYIPIKVIKKHSISTVVYTCPYIFKNKTNSWIKWKRYQNKFDNKVLI